MPIRASLRHRYPDNWEEISQQIRFDRARGRCECEGECGKDHDGRCLETHGEEALWTDKPVRVALGTAHLDHTPENNAAWNLRAFCQHCHLRYDAKYHNEERWEERRRKLEAAGQMRLFEEENGAVQLWLFNEREEESRIERFFGSNRPSHMRRISLSP